MKKEYQIAVIVAIIGIIIIAGSIIIAKPRVDLDITQPEITVNIPDMQENIEGIPNSFGGAESTLRHISLIGTGKVASTTESGSTGFKLQTFFQFASSTNEVYWDTAKSPWPQMYGSTSSPAFYVGNADMVNLTFTYQPLTTDSVLTYELAYSQDAGCNQASSTLNLADWTPLPEVATSTPWNNYTGTSANNIATGATDEVTWGITIKDITYDCLKLTVGNASTTDASRVYVEATLKEKN